MLTAVVRVSDTINKYGTYLLINDLKQSVQNKIAGTENYFLVNSPPDARLSFTHQFFDTSLNYVPDYSSGSQWVEDSLKSLGYSDTNNDNTALDEFEDSLRATHNVDNLVVVFVPAVGPQRGGLLGYAYPSGDDREFAVVFAYEIQGIAAMGSEIYTHEILHLFGTRDEYPKAIYGGSGCTGGETSYWARQPMQSYYPNYNCQAYLCSQKSIMQAGDTLSTIQDWFNISTPIDFWARGMVGWSDFDMNGVPDAYDNASIQFVNHAPVKMSGIFSSDNVASGLENRIISFRNPKVVSYSVWSDLGQGGTVTINFVPPNGNTISSSPVQITAGGCNDTQVKVSLPMANTQNVKSPGLWKVRADYNGQAIYYDPFRITAPVLSLSPLAKDLGVIHKGDVVGFDATIGNSGDDYMNVLSASLQNMPSGSTASALPRNVLQPSESTTSTISVGTSQAGSFTGSFTVTSDDPVNPVASMTITGIVKELIKLSVVSTKDYIEAGDTVRFVVYGNGQFVNNVGVNVDSKSLNTGSTNEFTYTFDKPGTYTITVSKGNTSTADYVSGSLAVEVHKKKIEKELVISTDKEIYKTGEKIKITVLSEDKPVQSNVEINGQSKTTDASGRTSFTIGNAGTYEIRASKNAIETDMQIISFRDAAKSIDVVQASWLDSIMIFLTSLFGN